jgi:hypothetical protein
MATRTQPKTLSASRRKRRPQLESLEEKQLLSIVFGADSNGTYAYDSIAASRRPINSAIPVAMTEGMDGTLFASYNGQGTWRYDYGTNSWTPLARAVASHLSASQSDNALYLSVSGRGTWEYDGYWVRMDSHDALQLAAVNKNWVYASFGGDKTGTWSSQGGWYQINPNIPVAMDATPGGTLYASFSYGDPAVGGTWSYNPGNYLTGGNNWMRLTTSVADTIAAISDTDMIGSFDDGTWDYQNGWNSQGYELTTEAATQLGHSGSTVIGSWYPSGTFTYDASTLYWQYVGTQSYLVA